VGAESSSEKRYENSKLDVSLNERFDADDRKEKRNERSVCARWCGGGAGPVRCGASAVQVQCRYDARACWQVRAHVIQVTK